MNNFNRNRRHQLERKIQKDIELKYAIFDRELDGTQNLIIDSFMPNAIRANIYRLQALHNETNFTVTSYTMSDWFASLTSVRVLPFSYALQMLNIKNYDLKQMIQKIKQRKIDFVFVGAGGVGMNTAHWLGKILDHTGDAYIFNSVSAYDNDNLEFSNLIRIPANLSSGLKNSTEKVGSIPIDRLSKKVIRRDKNLGPDTPFDFEIASITDRYDLAESVILYGAPSLETREFFNEKKFKFISATHGDDSCSMILNPAIDTSLQIESYGVIKLTQFFFNQIMMAVELLKFLSSYEPSDFIEDKEIFNFNFTEYVTAGKIGKSERKIGLQIQHSGLIRL